MLFATAEDTTSSGEVVVLALLFNIRGCKINLLILFESLIPSIYNIKALYTLFLAVKSNSLILISLLIKELNYTFIYSKLTATLGNIFCFEFSKGLI